MSENLTNITQEVSLYTSEEIVNDVIIAESLPKHHVYISPTLEIDITDIQQIGNQVVVEITNVLSSNSIEIISAPIPSEISITDIGVQGISGARGLQGIGLEYSWSDTKLGIKKDIEASFNYVELKGDKGEPLTYNDLTPTQKEELLGGVGNTSTNYTNIFYASLL